MLRAKKIISCVSPAAAGKTFFAINLAVVIAQLSNVALLDLDFREKSMHTWLNLPPGCKEIKAMMSGEQVEPLDVLGIAVYSADPGVVITQEEIVDRFIENVKAEIIIVDMPRELEDVHKRVLRKSDLKIWIGDPDYHHLLKLGEVIEREPFLIINKYIELRAPLDYRELFGTEPEKIPMFEGVYDSIITGEPLVNTDVQARKLFERLYSKIKLKII